MVNTYNWLHGTISDLNDILYFILDVDVTF